MKNFKTLITRFYDEESVIPLLAPFLKKGGGIHIKKENRGKFTESAKRAGESVQQHARKVVNNPNSSEKQRKRAQFCLNASKWKH